MEKFIRTVFLSGFLLCVTNFLFGQTPPFAWATSFNASSYASGKRLIAESPTIFYQAADFNDTIDADPGNSTLLLTTNGHTNGLVSKLTINNQLIWYRQFTGKNGNSNTIQAISSDGSGRVYIAGGFSDTIDLNPGINTNYVVSAGNNDCFLVCLDSGGQYQWGRSFGGPGLQSVTETASDQFGNIYLTGVFTSTINFTPNPGDTLNAGVNYISFICRFDSSGTFIWARSLQGLSNITSALDVDHQGKVIIGGSFSGTTDFDWSTSVNNISANSDDIFLMKFDSTATIQWVHTLGGSDSDVAEDLTTDAAGNIYTIGVFKDVVDFDPGINSYNLSAQGNWDIFILKIDSAGLFNWAKPIGGTDYEWGYAIDVDQSGAAYATGHFAGIADFDPGTSQYTMTSVGYEDIFIVKLSANGLFRWAFSMGGIDYDLSNDITVVGANDFLVTGNFVFDMDCNPDSIDTFLLSSGSNGDFFTAHYGQTGVGIPEFFPHSKNTTTILLSPNDNFVNLYDMDGKYSFTVIDLSGKTLSEGELSNGQNQLPFSFISGSYFIKFVNEEKVVKNYRIFKE